MPVDFLIEDQGDGWWHCPSPLECIILDGPVAVSAAGGEFWLVQTEPAIEWDGDEQYVGRWGSDHPLVTPIPPTNRALVMASSAYNTTDLDRDGNIPAYPVVGQVTTVLESDGSADSASRWVSEDRRSSMLDRLPGRGKERVSRLADLADELREIPESELAERLGSPERVGRRLSVVRNSKISAEEEPTSEVKIATVISALALPLGVLALFSFGGQLIFGPFVLAIEWILARISPRLLRFAWSFLGAALAGEIIYLVLNNYVRPIDGLLAVIIGLAGAVVAALIFLRTTGDQ